jgi:microcystin-dependent protein
MPRNGNGSYSLPQPAFSPGTTISSSAVNSDFSDIAAALTSSISSDGQTPITGQLKFQAGTAAAPSHTFATDPTSGMYLAGAGIVGFSAAGIATVNVDGGNAGVGENGALLLYANGAIPSPVGAVTDFAGATAPTGWQLCYGQAISRTSYPELFFIIGVTYGIGDGSTTYNLPDCRGRATFGQDNMGGTAAGRISVAGDNFDGTVLGGSGGGQNQTLSTVNLAAHDHAPYTSNTAITDPGHGHSVNDPGHSHKAGNNQNFITLGSTTSAAGNTAASTTASTATATTGLTVSNNTTGITAATTTTDTTAGSGTPFSVLSPAIIFNKIIFAGRP